MDIELADAILSSAGVPIPEDPLLKSLAAARQLQQDRLNYGIDRVHRYFDDVDGDWLERWGEDDKP